MKKIVLSAFSAVLMLAGSAYAEESTNWSELIDQTAQAFEAPYKDLSYDQIQQLLNIVASRSMLQSEGVLKADQAMLEERVQEAQVTLATDGIDADWLIDQRWLVKERREKAATAGNPAISGKTVTLTGYAIPAPPDADGANLVYLVPERGMCSHMPPPNPNQMVKARVADDWRPSFTHKPVRITGMISIAPSQSIFNVVDGVFRMNATLVMDVRIVETLADMKEKDISPSRNGRAGQMATKLRPSGAPSAMPVSE